VTAPLIHALHEFYGLQPTPPADLFQFFAWEILSDQALPARRDLAWQALRRIPALTPDAMFRAPAGDLLDAIGTAGPHREEKLERIRAVVGDFKRHRDELSHERLSRAGLIGAARALRRLDHVPAPVRARALLFAVGQPVLPMDEDALRVVARLMGAPHSRRRSAARRWLSGRVATDLAGCRDAIVYLRHHAQHTCLRVGPHCGVCPLAHDCGSVERRDPPA
jgi:endonuclease III